jgi:hypothetical protein
MARNSRLLTRKSITAGAAIPVLLVAVVFGLTHKPFGRAAGVIGDLNGDGTVNVFDLSILLSDWGTNTATADLNHDGTVNVFDLSTLLSNWGQTGATPTPTPAPTPSPTPTGVACVTSQIVDNGDGKTFCPGPGEYYTDSNIYGNNNMSYVANAVPFLISNVSQTLTAYSPENWHVVTSIPNGNTSVVAAPQTRVDLFDTNGGKAIPLSSFPSLYSSFAESMQNNPGVAYNASYDVWGGDANISATKYEMMIWYDQKLRGNCGGATKLATTSFGGAHGAPVQNWTLCRNGSATATSEFIWYLSDASGNVVNETSGTVDILPFSQYMVSHGYYPSNYGLTQVVFGTEICSSGNAPATFTVTKFTLSAN